MYIQSLSSKVKLLAEANEQLQKLIQLREDSFTNVFKNIPDQGQQSCQQLNSQSNKTVQMFNQLIRLYSIDSTLISHQQSEKSSYRSNVRSHSRTHAKTQLKCHSPDLSDSALMISTLSCTLAYLYTNFQNRLEDAAGILLRAKAQIQDYVLQVMLKIAQSLQKQPQDEQSQVQEYFKKQNQLKTFVSHSLGQFVFQNPQIFKEYCSSNFPSIKTYLRISMNLMINLLLQKKYTYSVEVFNELVNFIEGIRQKNCFNQCLNFVSQLLFGSCDFLANKPQTLEYFNKFIEAFSGKDRKLSIQQAITVSHLIFNLDLLCQKYSSVQPHNINFLLLLQKSLQTFITSYMYEYAFFTLRHLLQSTVQKQRKQQYEYVLNELLINEKIASNLSLQNIQSVQCFRCIIQTLIAMAEKNQDKNQRANEKDDDTKKSTLFKLIIRIKISQVSSDDSIPQTQRFFILKSFQRILNESSPTIIDDLLNQQLTKKLIFKLNSHCQKLTQFCLKPLSQTFKLLKTFSSTQQRSSRIPLSQRRPMNYFQRQNSFLDGKSQLKNVSVSPSRSKRFLKLISTSIHSEAPSVILSTTQRQRIFQPSNTICDNEKKKISKMVRLCEYGAFLNKRNFNSDGGESKFIKVTSNAIKWSKSAQNIDEEGQSYPLKDIKGCLYGKITPNMKKSSNKNLKQENCFSLVLQKRTMDLYCKDYNEVQTWVCGLSQILKKQGQKVAGYTPGKMKWRKMFALLRKEFIEPLKVHERNKYYFENAYSLILFRENGYQLPQRK